MVKQKAVKIKTQLKQKTINKPTPMAVKKIKKKETVEQVKIKLISKEELAKFVGVDPKRIQQLTQDGVIKKEPGKHNEAIYDFVRTVHALLQYYRVKSDSRRSSESEEMAAEKIKQVSVKRRLEELKLAQLEGELHKAEDIERIMGAMLTRLRINLLAIPMGLAPVLCDMNDIRDIAEKLDERIRRAMNEVAELDLKKLVEEEDLIVKEA